MQKEEREKKRETNGFSEIKEMEEGKEYDAGKKGQQEREKGSVETPRLKYRKKEDRTYGEWNKRKE